MLMRFLNVVIAPIPAAFGLLSMSADLVNAQQAGASPDLTAPGLCIAADHPGYVFFIDEPIRLHVSLLAPPQGHDVRLEGTALSVPARSQAPAVSLPPCVLSARNQYKATHPLAGRCTLAGPLSVRRKGLRLSHAGPGGPGPGRMGHGGRPARVLAGARGHGRRDHHRHLRPDPAPACRGRQRRPGPDRITDLHPGSG